MNLRAILFAALACLLWSTAFVGIKIGLQYSEQPLLFAGLRFIIAGLILIPFLPKKVNPVSVIFSHFKKLMILGFFQTALLYGLLYIGMTFVSGAIGAIIIGSSPLIAALTAHFFMEGDKMTMQKTAGIVVGIIGICVISFNRMPFSIKECGEFIGIILLLAGVFSSAVGNVLVAKDKDNIDPILLNSAQIFIGGIFLFLLSIPIEGIPNLIHPYPFYIALLWLSFISAVAFSLWFYLLKEGVKVSDLNLWKFIIPVFGAILSWIFLPNEHPHLNTIIGMICITGSIVLYNFRFRIYDFRF